MEHVIDIPFLHPAPAAMRQADRRLIRPIGTKTWRGQLRATPPGHIGFSAQILTQ
jgi:hypothetical protein